MILLTTNHATIKLNNMANNAIISLTTSDGSLIFLVRDLFLCVNFGLLFGIQRSAHPIKVSALSWDFLKFWSDPRAS